MGSRRLLQWLAPAMALAALSSCGRPVFLLFADAVSWQLMSARGLTEREMQGALGPAIRLVVEVQPAGQQGDQALAAVLERRRPRWVFRTSLFSTALRDVAAQHAGITFVEEGADPPGVGNLVRVVYSRDQAHFEAGQAVSRLLGSQEALDALEGPGAGRGAAGVISAVSGARTDEEVRQFQAGLASLEPGRSAEYGEVGSLSDRVKTRRILERMREAGAGILLLKTYSLTGFCMEYLQEEGGLAIVDDALGMNAFPDHVLLALQDDFLGALRAFSLALEPGAALRPGTRYIQGPVRLIWGARARALPAPLRRDLGIPDDGAKF